MNKKALIPMTVLAVLAVPGIAAAHNATANGTCGGGVTWSVTNYQKEVVNTIVVKVDGVVVHQDLDFKASDTGSHATDMQRKHTWSVDVDAPGTQYDKHLGGVYAACVEVEPTTVPSSTTTVDPTTTTLPCQEDQPCFDCTTMGNQICGTTTTVVAVGVPPVPTTVADLGVVTPDPTITRELPRTGGTTTVVVLAALLVFAGIVVLAVRRR